MRRLYNRGGCQEPCLGVLHKLETFFAQHDQQQPGVMVNLWVWVEKNQNHYALIPE